MSQNQTTRIRTCHGNRILYAESKQVGYRHFDSLSLDGFTRAPGASGTTRDALARELCEWTGRRNALLRPPACQGRQGHFQRWRRTIRWNGTSLPAARCGTGNETPDPGRPAICFDESPTQLISETRTPVPARPGWHRRIDSECRRNGTANLFVFLDAHRPRRKVMERRTAADFAACMRDPAMRTSHKPGRSGSCSTI